jgi:hypothetical protein
MDELLTLLAQYIEQRIKKEMTIPRARFSKVGNISKGNYNFVGSGSLRDSVKAFVDGEDIVVVMNDYGVDFVFSDLAEQSGYEGGSFPGQGRYEEFRGRPGQEKGVRGKFSPLLAALEKWVKDKIGLQGAKAKSMAFAVRKNLFTAGYKGLPLITDVVENDILQKLDQLLSREEFADVMVEDILDRINIFAQTDYDLTII